MKCVCVCVCVCVSPSMVVLGIMDGAIVSIHLNFTFNYILCDVHITYVYL